MMKLKRSPCIAVSLALICLTATLPSNAFASCEEDCEVPRSCKEYLECRVAQMECLAACKQKEAWELSARSSEKFIAATERMAQVLEKTFEMSEKITRLLDKMIVRVMQESISEKPPENQESPAPSPTP
jgi:hypothetical protein